jgi:hypothetical protein
MANGSDQVLQPSVMTDTALSLMDIPTVMSHHGVRGLCGDPKNIKEVEVIGGSINIFFIS